MASIGERPRQRVAETIAAVLVAAGILLAAWLAGSAASPGSLARPIWLVPAGLWLLAPHRSAALRWMQDLVFTYISLVLVSEAARLSWEIGHLRVSASVACVALAGTGWLVQIVWCDRRDAQRFVPPHAALAAATGVLAVHALALAIMLHGWYGYGYEADLTVAGRVALCIVWLELAGPLAKTSKVRAALAATVCLAWAWSRA